MKTFFLAPLLLLSTAGFALAVWPGQTITFDGGGAGAVAFSGEIHRQPCSTCHNQELFPRMQKGATPITMEAIDAGRLCGSCHNGEQAFASRDNCLRCHQENQDQ
jgi:c(7)-type cytochrome triheme protein